MTVRYREDRKSWLYRFKLDGLDYSESGFLTEKDAKSAERKKLGEIEAGKKPLSSNLRNMSFAEAAEIFYNEYGFKLAHEKDYRCRLPIIAEVWKGKKLVDITKEDIKALREYLLQTQKTKKLVAGQLVDVPIGKHTVNHYHAHIKAIFNWWIKEKEANVSNPAEQVEFFKVPKARVRFLYPAEEKLLTPAVIAHPWLWPYYKAGLETGLRETNLCNIRVKDVDLVIGKIYIPKTKNGESGYVPISDNLRAWVVKWAEGKQPDEKLLPGGYRPNSVSNKFTELTRKIGIADFSFHCLRHTFAYKLLSHGVSVYLVSKLLLHKDVRVTEKHYGHMAICDLQRAINSVATSELPQNLHQGEAKVQENPVNA